MRGEGPGFPLQRHQHLLPTAAESRERGRAAACQAPSCSVMPPQAQNVCFVSGPQWQHAVPAGPTGMALHGFFSCISIPCQLGPRASLAWGALAHPISPLGFSVGTDHMKDVAPQTRTDAIPQQSGTGAEASSRPRAVGHLLRHRQGPGQQGSPGTSLTSEHPQHPHHWTSGYPACCGGSPGLQPHGKGSRSRLRGSRQQQSFGAAWLNHLVQEEHLPPCSRTAGLP